MTRCAGGGDGLSPAGDGPAAGYGAAGVSGDSAWRRTDGISCDHGFLAGLVGLGLPVYVHLLRKQTTVPRPFSSLMFFERGIQSSTRHRRLRYLLLFALRMALVFLLVLAFANPFIRRANAGASGRLLLVVVDNSFRCGRGRGLRMRAGGEEGAGGEAVGADRRR